MELADESDTPHRRLRLRHRQRDIGQLSCQEAPDALGVRVNTALARAKRAGCEGIELAMAYPAVCPVAPSPALGETAAT